MEFFDLHCDTLYECYYRNQPLYDNSLAVSLRQGAAFKRYIQTFAVFIPDETDELPMTVYQNIIDNARREFDKNSGCLHIIKTAEDLSKEGIGVLLSVEGGRVLEGDVKGLDRLYNDGVRMLTLTWNGESEIAGGAYSDSGLTGFGRQVINKMNELGMAVDLSHLNRRSFYEALPLCRYPAASHSCFDAVKCHPRNLTDEQFAAIAKQGGVVGLCLYPDFLGEGNVFESVYAHICRALELGGEDTLAIGSDFDGAEMDSMLCKLSQIPELIDFLHKKSIPESIIKKIFCKNAMNFCMKVLTNRLK